MTSACMQAGEIVSLIGPDGAGKTTTLLALAGELPPLSGEVRFYGEPVRADRVYVMRRGRVEISGAPADLASRLSDIEDSYLGRSGARGTGP
jgi:branched-chain amino acid transport system ATP-binding protein